MNTAPNNIDDGSGAGAQEGVAWADLPALTDGRLQRLGVATLGRRRHLLAAAAALPPQPPLVPPGVRQAKSEKCKMHGVRRLNLTPTLWAQRLQDDEVSASDVWDWQACWPQLWSSNLRN